MILNLSKIYIKILILTIVILGFTSFNSSHAEEFNESILLKWKGVSKLQVDENYHEVFMSFDNADYSIQWGNLPVFTKFFDIYYDSEIDFELTNEKYIELTEAEKATLQSNIDIPNIIFSDYKIGWQSKKPFVVVTILPFKKFEDGSIKKLSSFDLSIITTPKAYNKNEIFEYSNESVLNNGKWYKIRLSENGIYKITYDDLKDMGIDVDNINPQDLGVFGNGGDLLKEQTDLFRYDDLQENAIYISGESDNKFDQGDYILFYGDAPHYWEKKNINSDYKHTKHLFEDYSYYFIGPTQGSGKRIETLQQSSNPNKTITSFDDMSFYEKNDLNLIHSGREWFGEVFSYANRTFSLPAFKFHDIVDGSNIILEAYTAARASTTTSFNVSYNNQPAFQMLIPPSMDSRYTYAYSSNLRKELPESGNDYTIKIEYDPKINNSKGWLNFIAISGRSNLKFKGNQFNFRDYESAKEGGSISKFIISNATSAMQIWDITERTTAKKINSPVNNGNFEFILKTEKVHEFIAFDGSNYKTIEFVKQIANQNLHGIRNIDMVIIAHDNFLLEANELAELHRTHDNLKVFVIGLEPIYNEFASGSKDITAIRDFFRMLYKGSDAGQELRYAMFIGDGSYDMKNRINNNTDFVPTYQSKISLTSAGSYTSDDYFGLLDAGEGVDADGYLDIGLGRLPVKTETEARMMVKKIKDYYIYSDENTGDWKNKLTLIADDEDSNTHLEQAETLNSVIDTLCHELNTEKIYLDSYEQITSPTGDAYPDVRKRLNEAIQEGSFIVNYTGHGGEYGWSHEQILTIPDIEAFSNKHELPLFITATCEFSRYDNPELHSAGERVILNPNGGAIAMITTTRLAFSIANFNLNKKLYSYLLVKDENGNYPRLGDVMKHSKLNALNLNVHLLGDPALRLAHPKEKIIITKINGLDPSQQIDTLQALTPVIMEGEVIDKFGSIINDFNGSVFTTVFDKFQTVATLGNDPYSDEVDFEMLKNILYQGESNVINGKFSFSFIVPKDIAYKYGQGKISMYAKSEITDAAGFNEEFIIGGTSNLNDEDQIGPEITLYLNDDAFLPGDTTLEDPLLIAKLYDDNGINTLGNSIGHDITAVLDGEESQPYVLNPYYKATVDSYKEGTIVYRLRDLEDGYHDLELKVWDVYNNSSTANTHFYVSKDIPLNMFDLYNSPNPFAITTEFSFKHKHFGKDYTLKVDIFSTDGRLIKTIGPAVMTSDGYSSEPLIWNGTNYRGTRMKSGVYIYQFSVEAENDSFETKSGKLILID